MGGCKDRGSPSSAEPVRALSRDEVRGRSCRWRGRAPLQRQAPGDRKVTALSVALLPPPKPRCPSAGSPAYLARWAGHGRDAGAPGAGRHRAGGCRGSIARRRAEACPPCALGTAPAPAPGPARRRCRRMAAPAFRRRRRCGYARRGADLRPPRAGGGGSAQGRPQRLLRAAHPAGPP